MVKINKEEDILYQIDMQLYDEFNDTIATMYEHLGDIYGLRDVEEVEKAEKEKEIKLLREAIQKQQKENEELRKTRVIIDNYIDMQKFKQLDEISIEGKGYISKDKIKELIENNEENIDYSVHDIIEDLKELIGE